MRGGDPDFDEFVRERHDQLLRYAVMLTGRRVDAEEIVQEALLRCLARWRLVRPDNKIAYARKAVYHEFLRTVRNKPPVPVDELVEHVDVADFTGSVVAHSHVLQMLQQLPARQRAAVVYRVFGDMTEAQAAKALGCSVGTVKSLTSRGLAKIRSLWVAEEAAAPGRRGPK
ncbi:SigE family RNA polymerase sigma factor [Actinokineospora sp. G85]|uniref:SigE family RNA polymerase sigma factor n=1 Tax=Actinokineospora sp. G85 TaxID=3406626 RepID=UPI003C769DA5